MQTMTGFLILLGLLLAFTVLIKLATELKSRKASTICAWIGLACGLAAIWIAGIKMYSSSHQALYLFGALIATAGGIVYGIRMFSPPKLPS